MAARLFSDFSPSGPDAWQIQAEKELKGRLKTLSDWRIGVDLHLAPYLTLSETDPETMAAMQACQKKIPGWQNIPSVKFTDPRKTNVAMKQALANGADVILLDLGNTDLIHCEFPKLLHGIRLSDTAIYFRTGENAGDVFKEISKNAGYYLKGGVAFDPVAHWMRTGKSFADNLNAVISVLNQTRNMREFRAYMVEGHLFHNNGATLVQELGMMVSATVNYLDLLTDQKISPLIAFNRVLFSISIGTDFLAEIAKLRAFRFLLKKIADAYQLPHELCTPFIHAQTSTFFNADAAPYTNMIRASSEAMSAVMGGCNGLTVMPYDHQLKEQNDFSDRIARNVSSILSHESALAYVADPAAGSYMLEKMSLDIADKAWELFLEMEEKGGFVKCFETGFIQNQLNAALSHRIKDLSEGKVMIGINKYSEDTDTGIFNQKNDHAGSPYLTDKNLSQCFKASALTAIKP
ncbi:methylmalonyl-CoA mutase family protein [Dyadobacter chenwenxiniae]|uniref:Methylmalonyl-CoA mutase family protein n=1 Tax=Dyadobacter chenwenxiniae TaxID=2906456 RepID=A0A9X1PLV7_9BACT|nr:methylmalonyl-CoA mutase family protein [Dyadobacter chenwenxiniae]MCF0063707.1 methylmalonyl-CoA mutase family protein [Dyadobacter chenwenxiniae]UON83383.1 methylmalonyl-CoA mutase family protein [Dyadobacter chenwenxiniae]